MSGENALINTQYAVLPQITFDRLNTSDSLLNEKLNISAEDSDVTNFMNLVQKPKVLSFLISLIETVVANSESVKNAIEDIVLNSHKFKPAVIDILLTEDAGQLPQRTKALELKTGLVESLADNPEPSQDEQIAEHAQRIANIENLIKSPTAPIEVAPIEPIKTDSKTAYRATLLFNYLQGQKPRHNGEIFLTSSECYYFLKCKLPEEIKAVTSNMQQMKKEVLNKAVQLFPSLKLNKSKHGKHEVTVVLEKDSNSLYHKKPIDSNSLYHKRICG